MNTRASIVLSGIGASSGVAVGKLHLIDTRRVRTPRRSLAAEEVEAEVARLDEALAVSDAQLLAMKAEVEEREGPEHALIIDAHRLMLQDPAFADEARRLIRVELVNAEWAVRRCTRKLRSAFSKLGDEYFRERRHDVAYVADRVVRNLMGQAPEVEADEVPDGVVLVARDLSPAYAALILQPGKILGLVTDRGTKTSHTAIVAHARGIPAVVGVERASELAQSGDEIALDGERGEVVLRPDPAQMAHFTEARERLSLYEAALEKEQELPSLTRDGVELQLLANIEFQEEIGSVARAGAHGIGLFRTEFLYFGRGRLPTEDEHYEAYRSVLMEMGGRVVTIRTVDLGADKMPAERVRKSEPNPALGMRALRVYRRQPEIFRTQLRAILRASVHGPMKILFPMVTCVAELREARDVLDQARQELAEEGVPMAASIPVGAMIEVPSAVYIADRLARDADFFSIGSNDLIQYSLAIDRQNREVAYLYRPMHLSILRMIRGVVEAARERDLPVSVCGEMAGEPLYALILLGLGVDQLSMAPSSIPLVRRVIRSATAQEGRDLLDAAMEFDTSEEIEAYVRTTMEARFGHLPGGALVSDVEPSL